MICKLIKFRRTTDQTAIR